MGRLPGALSSSPGGYEPFVPPLSHFMLGSQARSSQLPCTCDRQVLGLRIFRNRFSPPGLRPGTRLLLRDEMPPLLRSVTACHSLCDAVLDKVEGAGAGEGQGAHGV
eukprot:7379352-Prymnesium_polylepis.3